MLSLNLRLKLFKEIKANESIISELHVRIPEMVEKQVESYKHFPVNKILTKEDHEKQKLENRIDELEQYPFLTPPDVSLLNEYKDVLEVVKRKKMSNLMSSMIIFSVKQSDWNLWSITFRTRETINGYCGVLDETPTLPLESFDLTISSADKVNSLQENKIAFYELLLKMKDAFFCRHSG